MKLFENELENYRMLNKVARKGGAVLFGSTFARSIPLGALTGLILHWPAWLVQLFLRADYVIKSLWCIGRLYSGKWIHDVTRKRA